MPAITLSPKADIDASTAMFAFQISGKRAGEDLQPGVPVYLNPADDRVYKYATGQAFVGIAARAAKAGQPCTVYGPGVRFHASDTPLTSALYYVGTGGTINDAATAVDSEGAFVRVGPNDLMIARMGKLA